MYRGRDRAKEEFGVEIRWIVDFVRRLPDTSPKIQQWACRESIRNAGVVALGSGGPEMGWSTAQAAAFTFLNPHVYLDTTLLIGSVGAQHPAPLQ